MTLVELGRIVRLQAQLSSLKVGEGRARSYDPSPIVSVDALTVTANGVAVEGPDGLLLDVHHAGHPSSKNRWKTNSLSIGFTSHYDRMRDRFGSHLADGIAGENILIETDHSYSLDDIADGLIIGAADGRHIALESISVAHPCVEFSRFALNDPSAPAPVVSEVLRFLDGGLRGFYVVVPSETPLRVEVGDRVCLRVQPREKGNGAHGNDR